MEDGFFPNKNTLPKLHQNVEKLPRSVLVEQIGKSIMKPT